jgi:hypothetical protein
MSARIFTGLSVTLAVSAATTAFATPIQWTVSAGGNGHFYDFVSDPNVIWTDANTAADALTFEGLQGYLATITSAPENAFMATNFSAEAGPDQNGWLGGYQDTSAPDYSEPAGGWRWVTGEPWSYTNWAPGEPDNDGGDQNYLRSNVLFEWDDLENDPANPSVEEISGYFVEYSAVPEPGSLLLLGLATTMVLLRPRRDVGLQ